MLGIPNFLKADSSLTLLGESVADLLEILCLVRADGRPTLLGGEYCWILSYSVEVLDDCRLTNLLLVGR